MGDRLQGSAYPTPNSFYSNDSQVESLIKTQLSYKVRVLTQSKNFSALILLKLIVRECKESCMLTASRWS